MLSEFLKYIDCFGIEFNFYIEKNRKFYTPLGGILTFLSIILSILVFVSLNYSEFSHENPITSTYILPEHNINIKFGQENIWIPWRIRDYFNKKVDHKKMFYPLIYYYKGIRNDTSQGMNLTYDLIDYKLCNETNMVNRSDIYQIDTNLDDLYCINMEDLYIGGRWQSNFINYVEFDLFLCEDGINYNESDPRCTKYDTLINSMINNSYEMEIYYPLVNYQPTNKTFPIFVKYKNYFYHFSRFSNKIDRLYLQKYIFSDDVGWFTKELKNSSFWGQSSLSGDSYTTTDKRDLMNEGSSSRLYSFNIYLNSDIICYNRSYKKVMIIIAESLPIMNVIIAILGSFAKFFKISSGNRKLTELLFVNIKEKWKKFKDDKYNSHFNNIYRNTNSNNKSLKISKKGNTIFKRNSFLPNINKPINSNNNINNKNSNISENEISSSLFHLNHHKTLMNNYIKNDNEKKSNNSKINEEIKYQRNSKNVTENYSNIISNDSFNKTINNISINIRNNLDYENYKKVSPRNILHNKYLTKKNKKDEKNKKKEKYFVKQELFSYKYYLLSIFIKNINYKNNQKSICFPKKFLDVYNFICQILDISSYLKLQKEFQTIKNTLMKGKYRDIIENNQKINVNDRSFNVDMKECLDDHKLSILGKIKNSNTISNSNSNSKDNNFK